MANPEHVKILKQGVKVWNEWRESNRNTIPDLNGANLDGARLRGADLVGVDLTRAHLNRAKLSRVKFNSAELSGAKLVNATGLFTNFNNAKLNGANLVGAKLDSASLMQASLVDADFSGASLSGADLSNADLANANLSASMLFFANFNNAIFKSTIFNDAKFAATVLTNVDLSQATGIHLVDHSAPSSIGIDTLYKSRGQIPEVFLRGCGVPDSFIAQAKALIGAEEGIQFYSCFISYSGKDDEFAHRLHGRLQQEHVRVWFAPHDMQGGKKLHEQIDEAIRIYDKLLILLSPHSILSDWVMTELRKARKAERKTGKRKLFPIGLVDYTTLQEWECFDADFGQDLAVEVRQYFIPDFTNWKDHDAFESAFARLLKDLRADERAIVSQ